MPDYEYLYSRYYTILGTKSTAEKDRIQSSVSQIVKEFRDIWITMNVYPKSFTSIGRTFSKLLKEFHSLVTRGETQKQKPWWIKKAKLICDSMKNGVDIMTKDDVARKSIENIYGVKMTQFDINFYTDNCIPVCDEKDAYFGKCRRCMWSVVVDKNWLAAANKRQERLRLENESQLRRDIAEQTQETEDLSTFCPQRRITMLLEMMEMTILHMRYQHQRQRQPVGL